MAFLSPVFCQWDISKVSISDNTAFKTDTVLLNNLRNHYLTTGIWHDCHKLYLLGGGGGQR